MIRSIQLSTKRQLQLQLRTLATYASNPQIYIHKVNPLNYKFSLSKSPDAIEIGSSPTADPEPSTFTDNPKFKELLNSTIYSKIQDDFTFVMEAGVNANSFMPIYDLRETPNYARVPATENIFGYVRVDSKGKIVPESFQANGMYRLINGRCGLCKFSDFLHEQLQTQSEMQVVKQNVNAST
ncbi:uncharacterized protein SPAPADRAFT_56990 [Spathaspora passalidarum NRRL Y-27907]|uniref:Uncharacterized protein n=1 Tax=Spathaspora passalidarum (strain NRRL Y-27907 / 11-Y1) TaxID=619300 RepID=G3ASG6_SPAPN|nr:uncharacterized protein SPAPADRAFT_56990 [Spathaspora passalidarum NRRL Y-27907]EGW31084.1 hypothetical protein SPAPADRAFT_56990 [Spathaspora passalidarum NRRL Y-27907]